MPVAVAHGVLDQVGEDLVEPVGVGPHLGQLASGASSTKRSRSCPLATSALDVPVDDARRTSTGCVPHLQPPGVDAGDVEQLGDQPGDAVGVGLDRLEHQALLVVGEAVPRRSRVAENPLTEVSGERSSWATVEISAALVALGAAAGLGVAQGDDDRGSTGWLRPGRT